MCCELIFCCWSVRVILSPLGHYNHRLPELTIMASGFMLSKTSMPLTNGYLQWPSTWPPCPNALGHWCHGNEGSWTSFVFFLDLSSQEQSPWAKVFSHVLLPLTTRHIRCLYPITKSNPQVKQPRFYTLFPCQPRYLHRHNGQRFFPWPTIPRVTPASSIITDYHGIEASGHQHLNGGAHCYMVLTMQTPNLERGLGPCDNTLDTALDMWQEHGATCRGQCPAPCHPNRSPYCPIPPMISDYHDNSGRNYDTGGLSGAFISQLSRLDQPPCNL